MFYYQKNKSEKDFPWCIFYYYCCFLRVHSVKFPLKRLLHLTHRPQTHVAQTRCRDGFWLVVGDLPSMWRHQRGEEAFRRWGGERQLMKWEETPDCLTTSRAACQPHVRTRGALDSTRHHGVGPKSLLFLLLFLLLTSDTNRAPLLHSSEGVEFIHLIHAEGF